MDIAEEEKSMDFESYQIGKCYHDFRNMNGAKLYEQDGQLKLVIAYDNVLDWEEETFREAPLAITFKICGAGAFFLFKFGGYIVDAPFRPVIAKKIRNAKVDNKMKHLSVTVYVFESTSGLLIEKRMGILPQAFSEQLTGMIKEWDRESGEKYDSETLERGIRDIYDNYTLDELYELPGDREITGYVESMVGQGP